MVMMMSKRMVKGFSELTNHDSYVTENMTANMIPRLMGTILLAFTKTRMKLRKKSSKPTMPTLNQNDK